MREWALLEIDAAAAQLPIAKARRLRPVAPADLAHNGWTVGPITVADLARSGLGRGQPRSLLSSFGVGQRLDSKRIFGLRHHGRKFARKRLYMNPRLTEP
jgi:hypothetical protein